MTQTEAPSRLTRMLASVTTDSVASKLVSATSITALLTGAAYQWRIGRGQGMADRRGVSTEYIQLSSDPAATPVHIVVLLLIVSTLALLAVLLVPTFTIWHVPAALGMWFLFKAFWDGVRNPHTQDVQSDLIAAAALFLLAAAVAVVGRMARGLAQARRDKRPPRPLPPRLRSLMQRVDSHIPAWWDKATNLLPIALLILLLLFAALGGVRSLGTWYGKQTAQPTQAVVRGGSIYGVLGETSGGLMVVRSVDFCGASSPETAVYARVAGARSLLLNPEELEVIRLRSSLRLVDQCPTGQ